MILRCLICIPSFDNPGSILSVTRDCLENTGLPVLIVDDGSARPVLEILNSAEDSLIAESLSSHRLRIVRFENNQGKGAALQEAFRVSVAAGYTHLIAMDGDGQHLVTEISKLLEAALAHPWKLIVGNRRLTGPTVPESSKFGRRFSNFWVGYQTGSKVTDSQSGLRIYPLFHVQTMRFWTRRYDFEIEVLIRLIWKGVGVQDVEIDVFYPEKELRVSHFDKLWDNVRISCLNTVLVALSLLKTHRSPLRMAQAGGLGVFVGCTPFFGFHSLLVAGLSVLFRLNFVMMWIGSQVSIPPLAPFLAFASITLGTWLRNGTAPEWREFLSSFSLREVASHSGTWVLGSLAVGLVLGIAAGLLIYVLAWMVRGREKNAVSGNWTGQTRGGALGNWILKTIVRKLGLNVAYFCLYFLIPYFYLFAPKARRAANEYWQIMRPQTSFLARQRLIFRQLLQFGKLLLDRLSQSFSQEPRFHARPHGLENIHDAIHSRQGAILLSAHMGGWDMAGALLRADGVASDFHRVQFEAQGLTFNKVLGENARQDQITLRANGNSQPVLQVRELLEQGKPVGLMGDRPLGGHFELVLFLGKLAPFDVTAFRIAAVCDAPLVFTFGFKAEGACYDFFATPARHYHFEPGLDRGVQCARWVQAYAAILEEKLRRHPEQWGNFFPFWSCQPSLPGDMQNTRRQNRLLEEFHRPAKPAPDLATVRKTSAEPAPLR